LDDKNEINILARNERKNICRSDILGEYIFLNMLR
jgi:hypothetical protein